MAIAKTSRLEAVNTMLSVIGEAPVNDLTSSSAATCEPYSVPSANVTTETIGLNLKFRGLRIPFAILFTFKIAIRKEM